MTSGADWQAGVGRNWAEMFRKTDRSFAGLTQRLLERIEGFPGQEVLDLGCGAGELALAVARMRPLARVTGLDISEDLLAAARQRAGERSQVRFELADAARWQPQGGSPDLLVSRHGVMFFDQPAPAFAHLRELSAPRANLVFSCFRDLRENGWASQIASLLPQSPAPSSPPPQYAPGPFAFSDPDFVRAILAEAGWTSIAFEAFDFAYVAGQGEDAVGDAEDFFSRIGPFAAAMRECDADGLQHLRHHLRALLDRNCSDGLVVFPAAAWIVTARNG